VSAEFRFRYAKDWTLSVLSGLAKVFGQTLALPDAVLNYFWTLFQLVDHCLLI
jgi:hypothetical protein